MHSFVAKSSLCEDRSDDPSSLHRASVEPGAAFRSRAAAQTSPALIPLKIGVIPIESAAEAFYAVDMGFFKKQGLDVELQMMQNGSAIAAAVAGGSLDIGFADTISIATAHARGLPFIYLAPTLLNSYAAPTLAMLVSGAGPIKEAEGSQR